LKIAVITVSDRASAGIYADRSGPAIEEILREALDDTEFERSIVPDGEKSVLAALERHAASGADWIITTGGTGPAPRDQTPEAAEAFCDRELPGLAEYLRAESLKETPNAVFSRLYAGLRGPVYVVALPGSEKAARFCALLLAPLVEHGTRMARGEGH
jgi:molybdopterin adenylyltransferase